MRTAEDSLPCVPPVVVGHGSEWLRSQNERRVQCATTTTHLAGRKEPAKAQNIVHYACDKSKHECDDIFRLVLNFLEIPMQFWFDQHNSIKQLLHHLLLVLLIRLCDVLELRIRLLVYSLL